ncbi:MAG TPA: hypothetical protein VN256_08615 [Pyrinomonadaceae bacterium]|nr:hypothetical protein [Pyrinomonadaceae bacterium]
MIRNKDREANSGPATAARAKEAKEKERRVNYGRRSTDITPNDVEMLGKLDKAVDECLVELEQTYERMERDQAEFDRLKSESRVMLTDTKRLLATFQTG